MFRVSFGDASAGSAPVLMISFLVSFFLSGFRACDATEHSVVLEVKRLCTLKEQQPRRRFG